MSQFSSGDTVKFETGQYGEARFRIQGITEIGGGEAYVVDVLESTHPDYEAGESEVVGPTVGNVNLRSA